MRTLLLIAILALTAGCTEFGKVEQGRAVGFDKKANNVTLIRDVSADAGNASYSGIPPLTMTLPTVEAEMGPEPRIGYLLTSDYYEGKFSIYDPATKTIKTLILPKVSLQEGVGKDHPLLIDPATGKARSFPVIDKARGTVTIYNSGRKLLGTYTLTPEAIDMPELAYKQGDVMRAYYKKEGVASRMMNVTQTDIFKK